MTTIGTVILALLAISEVLALIPSVGSNSIFQLIVNILKSIAPRISALFTGKDEKEVKDDKKERTKK